MQSPHNKSLNRSGGWARVLNPKVAGRRPVSSDVSGLKNMAVSKKKSHRIEVDGVEYRWRATGNDGWISLTVWPDGRDGPPITGNFKYHETWVENGRTDHGPCYSSLGDQIVITNRLVRRVIELATRDYSYDPDTNGKQLNLRNLDEKVRIDDAVRAR